MTLQKPEGFRSKIEETKGVKIVIPPKRNYFLLIFLAAWLIGWVIGELMLPPSLIKKIVLTHTSLFLITWALAWTLGGLFVIYVLLWNAFGKEIITVDGQLFSIKRELMGLGMSREYELAQIRNMRLAPVPFNPFNFNTSLQFWGIGGGVIAFDYGSRTYRFGTSIDEPEANHIIDKIKANIKV